MVRFVGSKNIRTYGNYFLDFKNVMGMQDISTGEEKLKIFSQVTHLTKMQFTCKFIVYTAQVCLWFASLENSKVEKH